MNLERVLNTVKSHSVGIALSSEIDGHVLICHWWLRNDCGTGCCAERIRLCSETPWTWSLSRTGLVVASRTHAPSLLPPPNTIMFFETRSGFPTANLSVKKDAPEYFETIFVKIWRYIWWFYFFIARNVSLYFPIINKDWYHCSEVLF